MAFRVSLENYMAVMVLSFNRIFRFSIYLVSRSGKSITVFTFALISTNMLCILACLVKAGQNAAHITIWH